MVVVVMAVIIVNCGGSRCRWRQWRSSLTAVVGKGGCRRPRQQWDGADGTDGSIIDGRGS
jgi:hypothetical protein